MSKTILITGASTGIGAATALELAAGNELFLHYHRSQAETEAVAQTVAEQGGTAHLIQADLSKESGCRRVAEAVAARTDTLDVLVNNAGSLVQRHQIESLEWDLIAQIFSLNTFSAMLMTRLCLPLLKQGTAPCIINITSIAARSGAPTATVYGAAKGALDSFTRGAARELAPHIRVNAVAPGVILTPFHDRFSTQEFLDRIEGSTPVGRHGASEEIARGIAFLIENEFTTGETLDINGGLFMR